MSAASARAAWRAPVLSHEHDSVSARDVVVDRTAHRVTVNGESIDLSPREYQLMELFVVNADVVMTREQIVEWIWGGEDPGTNTIEVHIYRLRTKIETDPRHPERLRTVRGLGYRFDSVCSAPGRIDPSEAQ